jgi:hypothetical protein
LRLFSNQVGAANSNCQSNQEAVMKKGLVLSLALPALISAQQAPKVDQVELQPLTAQVSRLIEALDYLGAPIKQADKTALEKAGNETDAAKARRSVQDTLDKYCLFDININPESRVRVTQGAARPDLVEKGWSVFLVKVRNEAGVTAQLKAESSNALPVYTTSRGNPRPAQQVTPRDVTDRWLDLAMFNKPPLKPALSGLELEYRVIQLYSRDAGKREARISFNVGQGTQDIGFRNDVDILFNCLPTAEVTLRVFDEHGKPTTASFVIPTRRTASIRRVTNGSRPISISIRRSIARTASGSNSRRASIRSNTHAGRNTSSNDRRSKLRRANPGHSPSSSNDGLMPQSSAGIRATITFTPPGACITKARRKA